ILLVIAQSLHRSDQVRNQIVSSLELHVHLGPALADALPQFNQAVIDHPDPTETGREKIRRRGHHISRDCCGRGIVRHLVLRKESSDAQHEAEEPQSQKPQRKPELICCSVRVETRNIGAVGSCAISGATRSCRSRAWPRTYNSACNATAVSVKRRRKSESATATCGPFP